MKSRNITLVLVACISILFAVTGNSFASDKDKDKGTMLTLSVNETTQVEEDLLVAYMQYEYEGQVAKEVQNTINKKMKNAIEAAKKIPEIQIATEQYNIYKHYPYRGRNNHQDRDKFVWRGSQSLVIQSFDSDKLLKLAGDLQDMELLLNGLNFVISPDKHEQVKDSLLEAAIQKLRVKADRAAKALGMKKVEFVSINVDNNLYYPQPVRRFAMSADISEKGVMSEPVATPGQSLINLSVSAVVRLTD